MPRQTRDLAQSRALKVILCDAHVLAFKALAQYFEDSAGDLINFRVLANCQRHVQWGSVRRLRLTLVSIEWNTVSSHAKRSITFVSSAEVTAAPTERMTSGEVWRR